MSLSRAVQKINIMASKRKCSFNSDSTSWHYMKINNGCISWYYLIYCEGVVVSIRSFHLKSLLMLWYFSYYTQQSFSSLKLNFVWFEQRNNVLLRNSVTLTTQASTHKSFVLLQ
jgi:hypothetical protein